MTTHIVQDALRQAIADSAWPGGVLVAGHRGETVVQEAFGFHTYSKRRTTRIDDVFDLASLTKVIATTSALMALVDSGRIGLDDYVVSHLPEYTGPTAEQDELKRSVTIRHLLAHCSGLPAWKRLWEVPGGKAARVTALLRTPLDTPPQTTCTYSDMGFIVLGELVAAVAGLPLDRYVGHTLATPLGMASMTFNPPKAWLDRIVPTERQTDGEGFLCGQVHDENARGMGGVAGNAGLFSTAADLAIFAQMMLNEGIHGEKTIFRPETVQFFTRRADLIPGSSRCLGWDAPTDGCSGGAHLSPQSFGHTGFTGTSLWIDPANDVFVILLTNAVHPDRAQKEPACSHWRRQVHSAVYEVLGLTARDQCL